MPPLHTRREFAKLALTALPVAGLFPALSRIQAAEPAVTSGKPNSKIAGVQLGLNVPYSFGNPAMSGADVLRDCVRLGLSAVELRAQPVELFLGVPSNLVNTRRNTAQREDAAKATPADPAAAKIGRAHV